MNPTKSVKHQDGHLDGQVMNMWNLKSRSLQGALIRLIGILHTIL